MKKLTKAEKRHRDFWRTWRSLMNPLERFNRAFRRAEKLCDALILLLEAVLAEEESLRQQAQASRAKKPKKLTGTASK